MPDESPDEGRQDDLTPVIVDDADTGNLEDADTGTDSHSSPGEEPERLERPLGGRSMTRRRESRVPSPRDGIRPALSWVRTSNNGAVMFVREVAVSVLVVLLIGAFLFALSGVWPPMVAVESGSMEPHLQRGDLVFVMEEHRLAPDFAVEGTGIVPKSVAESRDYERFGGEGDVIVYRPFGSDSATPVIHRAHFWVEEGENWYDRADPAYVQADSCEALRFCPAPYDGFITKGDNDASNNYYDQARGISTPVKPDWIRGTAKLRVPWLGWVRLAVSDTKLPGVAAGLEAIDGPPGVAI